MKLAMEDMNATPVKEKKSRKKVARKKSTKFTDSAEINEQELFSAALDKVKSQSKPKD